MEGTMTSTTALLVDPADVGGRPQAATVSVAREEIEEALASDETPELILEVQLRETERRELHVAWERSDLESILAGAGPGRIAFSFDPSELYRALEHPDFEGHGFREAILLTVAAASASAAVAVTTAQGGIVEGTGAGGGATAAMVSPGHAEAGTASTLATAAEVKDEAGGTARGIGVTIPGADEASLAARGIDAPAVPVGHDEALTTSALANPAAANDEVGLAARGIEGRSPAPTRRPSPHAGSRHRRPRRARRGAHHERAREPRRSERRGRPRRTRDRRDDPRRRRGDPHRTRDRTAADLGRPRRGDARRPWRGKRARDRRLGHRARAAGGRRGHRGAGRRARRRRPAARRRHVRHTATGPPAVDVDPGGPLCGCGPPRPSRRDQLSPRKSLSSASLPAGAGSVSATTGTSAAAAGDGSAAGSAETVRR